jgi:hypothetical protein
MYVKAQEQKNPRPVNPDIPHLRLRSADFQSASSVIPSVKPTASRRSGLLALHVEHELSGLMPRKKWQKGAIPSNPSQEAGRESRSVVQNVLA